jgi:hypothetical protein
MDAIQKYVKKKEQPEMVGHYEYDSKVFFLFGYKKGKKGTENKVELPPPYSDMPLFGDIIIITSLGHTWENPIPCTVEQWSAFYQQEEDEKEDSEDELSDAIVEFVRSERPDLEINIDNLDVFNASSGKVSFVARPRTDNSEPIIAATSFPIREAQSKKN